MRRTVPKVADAVGASPSPASAAADPREHLGATLGLGKKPAEPGEALRPARTGLGAGPRGPALELLEDRVEKAERGLRLQPDGIRVDRAGRARHQRLHRADPELQQVALRVGQVGEQVQQRGRLARRLEGHGDHRVVKPERPVVHQRPEPRHHGIRTRFREADAQLDGPRDITRGAALDAPHEIAVQDREELLKQLRLVLSRPPGHTGDGSRPIPADPPPGTPRRTCRV